MAETFYVGEMNWCWPAGTARPVPAASDRIRDLAEVEGLAGPDLLTGVGDRFRRALAELDRRDPKLVAIEMLEDPR